MRYVATQETLLPIKSVADGSVIVRHGVTDDGRPYILGGKGSPRVVMNHTIVTPDGAVFGPDAYPVDGRVFVVGRVQPKVVGKVDVKRPRRSGSNDETERAARATCVATKRDGTPCSAPATCDNGTRCVGHRGKAAVAPAAAVSAADPRIGEMLRIVATRMAADAADLIRLADLLK